MGDVVRRINGEKHIIYEGSLSSGELEYSTDKEAWIAHNEFTLIRPCDKRSFNKLKRLVSEDGDE
jgi:hypothetical protein